MKNVVEEAIFFVPQFVGVLANAVHGAGNPEEMFDEFHGQFFVRRVFLRQFQSNRQHVLAKKGHPGGAVGLFEEAARR
jgi:hypothetical protein